MRDNHEGQVTPQSAREADYKLVMSDINKGLSLPNAKQTEQVVVEPIDSRSACACSRHTARPCARRKLRPKKERCNALIGALHQLAHQAYFRLSGEKITHNETKTRASETHAKEQSRSVQSEP